MDFDVTVLIPAPEDFLGSRKFTLFILIPFSCPKFAFDFWNQVI